MFPQLLPVGMHLPWSFATAVLPVTVVLVLFGSRSASRIADSWLSGSLGGAALSHARLEGATAAGAAQCCRRYRRHVTFQMSSWSRPASVGGDRLTAVGIEGPCAWRGYSRATYNSTGSRARERIITLSGDML